MCCEIFEFYFQTGKNIFTPAKLHYSKLSLFTLLLDKDTVDKELYSVCFVFAKLLIKFQLKCCVYKTIIGKCWKEFILFLVWVAILTVWNEFQGGIDMNTKW